MATQGLVSIVDIDTNKVLFKIIAGCDGYNAKKVSDLLFTINKNAIDLPMLLGVAGLAGFGCSDCLVLMEELSSVGGGEELHERFRRTFNDPKFNPRWDRGTADYSEIIYV